MNNPTDWMDPDKSCQNVSHELASHNRRAVVISLENLQIKNIDCSNYRMAKEVLPVQFSVILSKKPSVRRETYKTKTARYASIHSARLEILITLK